MKTVRSYFVPASVVALFLLHCANAYQQFYTDLLKGQPISSSKYLVPNYGEPQIYRGSEPESDAIAMLENGYALVGYSSFNGPINAQNDAASQARTVHAAVALVYGKFSHSVTGSIPYTVYTPGQIVTTNSNGTIYDPSGVATYTGTSSTYLPGTSTTYQTPYQINRYDQAASFWVKTKPSRLGIIHRDLTQDERQRYQRNRGIAANAIVKGSPAFLADILRGDVVIHLGKDDIVDASTYIPLIDKYEGQDVEIIFLRNGQQFTKNVHINRTQ